MMRRLAPFAVAAMIAATAASAQTAAPVHKATVGDVKVSGVVATTGATGAPVSSLDKVTNLLGDFSDVQPAMPVLAAPGGAQQPGANRDCVGPSC